MSFDLERLDAHRWAELDRVLEVVLELTPDAVDGALDRLCGRDEELKAQVRAVLAADREGAGTEFLTKPAIQISDGPLAESVGAAPHGSLARATGRGFGYVLRKFKTALARLTRSSAP